MKKLFITLLIFVLVICAMTSCNNEENQKEDPTKEVNEGEVEIKPMDLPIEEIALLFTQDLIDGNYEDAYNKYAYVELMKNAVSVQKYKQAFGDLFKELGELKEIKKSFTSKSGQLDIVSIPIQFEKGNINLNVIFDLEKYIGGVNLGEYQEAATAVMSDTITEQELTADVNGFELGGTLTTPKEGNDFPCVILVHGSGANDRDESYYQNKTFRDIAWGLAEQGIAVYRYDKRTYVYAEELGKDTGFTIYDETINDAVEIAKMIQSVDKINKDNVYILGHSLGGYSIPRIAENSKESAGFIIMAGNARSLREIIPLQYEYIFNADGVVTPQEQIQLNKINDEFEKIDNINELNEEDYILGANKAYWVDISAYDPIKTAKSLEKPVLVLQGERDYQATMEDFNIWKDAFSSNNKWTFINYPKLNHFMMSGEGMATPDEYKIPKRVDQKLIDDITTWIKSVQK